MTPTGGKGVAHKVLFPFQLRASSSQQHTQEIPFEIHSNEHGIQESPSPTRHRELTQQSVVISPQHSAEAQPKSGMQQNEDLDSSPDHHLPVAQGRKNAPNVLPSDHLGAAARSF
jgi:hypothetical protein